MQQPGSGGIMQSLEGICVCFQERYYKVCMARAAVNKMEVSEQKSACRDGILKNQQDGNYHIAGCFGKQ